MNLFSTVNTSYSSSHREVELIVGNTTTLSCESNLTDRVAPVKWIWMKSPTSRQQHVLYSDGRINVNEILTQNMTVTTINSRQFNLVIDNVQLNHSGWYVCIEDNGLGPLTHSFKLQPGL